MILSTAVILGATLGTASGILTLCGLSLLCKFHKKKQLAKDLSSDPEKAKQSVLHSSKQFSIKKLTEPIQPRALLEFPKIYTPKPSVTSPEIINQPENTSEVASEPAVKRDPATKPGHGNLATEGHEEVFITERQDSPLENPCGSEQKNGLSKSQSVPLPKLRFSVKHHSEIKELHIIVKEVDHVSVNGEGEGYVEALLRTAMGQREAHTSSKLMAAHMVWDEGLVLRLPGGPEGEGEVSLSLRCCDRFSRYTDLGTVHFKLADVDMMAAPDCWMDLLPPKMDVSMSAGEILLSISYLPAANRLGVVVMKARGLESDKLKDTIDLSVKLALKHQSTKLRKKQTRRVKHKINPVWNEMLMLEVPRELLAKSSLELVVLNQGGASGAEAAPMGRCQLGLQASGTGLQHWKQMLDNPRKQTAMWHPLYA